MSMSTRPIESHITCKCSPIKLSTKVAYPQSRFKHASCLHENFVYIFAGKDGNISLKDFWRLNIVSLKWECVNFRGDNPQHLEGHTLVSCKKLLLLFGGQFGDSLTESSLWIINPDLGYIRRSVPDAGSDRPCVRRHHSAVVYNSAMYIYGGYIDMKGSSSELWRYHVDDEEWELISPHQQSRDLPGGRHGHSCIVYNKHMYLYGGNTDLTPKQDLWCYSFGVNRWDRIKSKYGPPSLIGHTASLVGTRMFIFGGETNQQPVNNLWYFCFKTQKWTQIMLRDQIPARTFHSGHFVSASHQHDSSLKASSVPYLQKKMSRLNVDRPRSSPGVRLGSTESRSLRNLSELDRDLHKVTSVSQNSLLNESETKRICSTHESEPIQKPNVLKLNSQDSTESIKLEPSPSENTADKSPLCPKHTDINYNAIDTLDRNTVIRGLDNPGISDSTEELIRENCAIRTRSRSDIFCDSNKNNNSSAFNRSLSYTTELERKKDLLHRNSESNIALGYVSHDTVISDETLDTFCVKKTRLDPELVIEDLEFLDCFPNDVKIQYPRQVTLRVSRTSSESTLYDTDTLETIFLDDISEQRRNKTPPRFVKNGFESVKFEKDTNAIHFQGGKSELAEKYKNVKNNEISTVLNERSEFRDNFDNQRKTMPSDRETCFPGKPLHMHSESQQNETRNVPRANKSITTELPYILVFGGKDSTTVNFTVKPLPVWKLQISSL